MLWWRWHNVSIKTINNQKDIIVFSKVQNVLLLWYIMEYCYFVFWRVKSVFEVLFVQVRGSLPLRHQDTKLTLVIAFFSDSLCLRVFYG
jgi:hypothetical protein